MSSCSIPSINLKTEKAKKKLVGDPNAPNQWQHAMDQKKLADKWDHKNNSCAGVGKTLKKIKTMTPKNTIEQLAFIEMRKNSKYENF